MKQRKLIILLTAVALFCTGCSGTAKKEETPTTITVWHVDVYKRQERIIISS